MCVCWGRNDSAGGEKSDGYQDSESIQLATYSRDWNASSRVDELIQALAEDDRHQCSQGIYFDIGLSSLALGSYVTILEVCRLGRSCPASARNVRGDSSKTY